ncbi:MAG: hypothetical protein JWO96_577 [Candidatus Saccharibacteria bacterium]|nr:hypothetical protein [Candidatus Saccharibacteria bacterium]
MGHFLLSIRKILHCGISQIVDNNRGNYNKDATYSQALQAMLPETGQSSAYGASKENNSLLSCPLFAPKRKPNNINQECVEPRVLNCIATIRGMSTAQSIGACIYCDKTDVNLTDEHITPYAFGNVTGDILHDASCTSCAAITSSFELTMLRENFLPIRSVLQMPSRSKKAYGSVKQTVQYKDGTTKEIDVPHDKYLGQFGLPIFQPPSYFNADFTKRLPVIDELQTFNIGNVANRKWYEDQGIEQQLVHHIKSNKGQAYVRFIMKIAYCAAVKFEGYEVVKDSPVRNLILGDDDHFAVYFGNLEDNQFTEPPQNNSVMRYAVASLDNSNKKLVAVQFFPFMEESPIYHTVV